jgi:hypothetical protein
MLEIGVFEARSAVWFLRNLLTHPNSYYVGIDPYVYLRRHEIPMELVECRERARANLAEFGDRATLHEEPSEQRLSRFLADGVQFDIVRVDGEHTAYNALFDITVGWRVLRPGGVMLVDDYDPKGKIARKADWGDDCPRTASDSHFKCIPQDQWSVLYRGYEIGVRKNERPAE